jgi:hypothetical protein
MYLYHYLCSKRSQEKPSKEVPLEATIVACKNTISCGDKFNRIEVRNKN